MRVDVQSVGYPELQIDNSGLARRHDDLSGGKELHRGIGFVDRRGCAAGHRQRQIRQILDSARALLGGAAGGGLRSEYNRGEWTPTQRRPRDDECSSQGCRERDATR